VEKTWKTRQKTLDQWLEGAKMLDIPRELALSCGQHVGKRWIFQ
jgi:hypothetical protein